jgi:hypothetical protein
VVYFTPKTIKSDFLPYELSKTVQIPSQAVLDGGFVTATVVCYSDNGFVFYLFILVESSKKNHSKSQKNHKMKSLILLEST